MFSGLIQTTGRLFSKPASSLRLRATLKRIKTGDSVAVNGVCLTVVEKIPNGYVFDLSPETKRKTTLSKLKKGQLVNVETPLKASDALGGHIVQGHVDGVGTMRKRTKDGMWFAIPAPLSRYLVPQGSIAIDGVSLTVAKTKGRRVFVALIPYTLDHTNLRTLSTGNPVNIEIDVLAKYVRTHIGKK